MLMLQIAGEGAVNGRYKFLDRTPLRTERLASERLAVEVRLPEAAALPTLRVVGTFALSARLVRRSPSGLR